MTVKSREVYQHFRGGLYEVLIPDAIDAETEQPVVIYRSLQTGQTWSRPLVVFLETVNVQGEQVPRFQEALPAADEDTSAPLNWETMNGHSYAAIGMPLPPTGTS